MADHSGKARASAPATSYPLNTSSLMKLETTASKLLKMRRWRCTKTVALDLGVTQQAISMASTRLERRGLAKLESIRRMKGRSGRPYRVFVATRAPQDHSEIIVTQPDQ